MLMFIKVAWRNLFRNKKRTIIAGSAIGIGLAALIFVDATIIGMRKNMIHSATASFMGEGQIYRQGFKETRERDLTLNNSHDVIKRLKDEDKVAAFAERTISFAMISSPANVSSVSLVGINPERERHLSQVDEALIKGAFFTEDNPRNCLIGSKLADILKIEVGDRIVLTVAQVHTDDLSQEMFRISGIFRFNIDEMDRGMAFIRLEKAQEMLNLQGEVHVIALKFTDMELGQKEDWGFWQQYSQNQNIARGWTELMPELHAALQLTDFSTFITAAILFGVVALGIINTLFMSIHERMFEFGVLRAVGTRPFSVAMLIIFEAGALALLSILFGELLGFGLTYAISVVGIDYTGIEFAGVTFRELLYPVLQVDQFIIYPFWVFVFTVVIGVYPAIYAARLSPADALQKTF
ncbi:FtsX-like permease family protein [candidate division KSB1 bacterium]|nr:FtsX-like permease family protein [candidate division KSB1 bacterium]